ncbi:MAG: phosphoribosylglycinamide synthetase C domain-containing protein, partial [Actinomycetes bacterium]
EAAQSLPGVQVLHAGTATDAHGDPVSAGGRVLSVVARGSDLADARARVYEAVELIKLRGSHYRNDIALAAARDEVVVPSAAGGGNKYGPTGPIRPGGPTGAAEAQR